MRDEGLGGASGLREGGEDLPIAGDELRVEFLCERHELAVLGGAAGTIRELEHVAEHGPRRGPSVRRTSSLPYSRRSMARFDISSAASFSSRGM